MQYIWYKYSINYSYSPRKCSIVNSNTIEVKDKLVINHPNNLIVKNDVLKYTKWDIYQIVKNLSI